MPRSAPIPVQSAIAPSISRRSLAAFAAALAIGGVVLLLHIRHYRPFLADDALISLRYAHRLLAGHGLTWTDGPRVEGYSNLLWVLLNAGLGALGVDLVAAARGLGVACALAALAALAWSQARGRGAAAAALTGALAVALAGSIAVWAAAGLETALVAALLAWAVALAMPLFAAHGAPRAAAVRASVPLALMVLTRPDAPLFTAAFVAALLLARGVRRETLGLAVRLALLPLAAFAGQETFRLFYYHAWVPNSALIKLALTSHRLVAGIDYLRGGLASAWPLAVLALLGAIEGFRRRETRAVTWLLVAPLVAWLGYVAFIGGDFFPGHRHLAPAAVLAAFLAAGAARALWTRLRNPWVGAAGIAILLAAFGVMQLRDPENARANRETWVWDGEAIGRLLEHAFGERRPLLAVVSAGCFPYWSNLPSLDMLGLNDAYVPHHPPREAGEGWAGHEFGDAGYVLSREPDLIQFSGIRHSERTGYFRVERELAASPEFQAHYELVIFAAREPRAATQPLWVRLDSPRIGIARTAGEVRIPGYLFATLEGNRAALDPQGRLAVEVTHDHPAGILGLHLAAGRWAVRLEPASDRVTLGARPHGSPREFQAFAGARSIPVESGSSDLVLSAAPGARVHVREVILTRVGR